jgi:hypothetical protein
MPFQFKDQAFWVRRNDIDILVLPVRFVDEIRNYTREQLSGIEALAFVSPTTSFEESRAD